VARSIEGLTARLPARVTVGRRGLDGVIVLEQRTTSEDAQRQEIGCVDGYMAGLVASIEA
jgi:hypothetical protein